MFCYEIVTKIKRLNIFSTLCSLFLILPHILSIPRQPLVCCHYRLVCIF